jgi:hypothetical protein
LLEYAIPVGVPESLIQTRILEGEQRIESRRPSIDRRGWVVKKRSQLIANVWGQTQKVARRASSRRYHFRPAGHQSRADHG